MKNTKFVIIIVVCVCVILGGYYYLTNRNNAKEEENITLTEIQELTTKNLDKNFPATPREVVKLYNRIITCFYNDEYTDDELYDLGDQARKLFDDELLENNPRDEYFKNLKEDISEYHDKNKTIASSAVDSSNDVEYKEVDGDDCAYVGEYPLPVCSVCSVKSVGASLRLRGRSLLLRRNSHRIHRIHRSLLLRRNSHRFHGFTQM